LFFMALLATDIYSQEIVCGNDDVAEAYKLAVNTVNINIRRGILAAGGDYGGEWARDISINSWNGVSLLNPKVAEKSLWSVTVNKDSIGHQYWDHIIWVPAALNHYMVTGDRAFLEQAYKCSASTLASLEQTAFDADYGLFTGPSVFNDGIAGYPEPIFDKNINSSFVLDHKNSHKIKCLSTNCVYYGAIKSLAEMARLLNLGNEVIDSYRQKGEALKANILKHLYSQKENKLYYLIDNNGKTDNSQEGLGLSFAVIFGVLDKEQATGVVKNAAVSKFGITSIYPDFPRFSPEKPGRHNNILWPMVNGYFARAAVDAGCYSSFEKELNGLTSLAIDRDKGNFQFWEIYNPYTGKPDGGWQVETHWNSCRYQTWSATAYINMVLYGLAGLRFENDGILFNSYLPEGINTLELNGIHYRQAVLNVSIMGKGNKIKTFSINGNPQNRFMIDAGAKGVNNIKIELE